MSEAVPALGLDTRWGPISARAPQLAATMAQYLE